MKINLPGTETDVIAEKKFTIVWYTLFDSMVKRLLGNQDAVLGGVINNDITSSANSGASATDLITYTLGANALKTTTDYIEIEAFGIFAANANAKSISLIFGSTTIYSISPTAINSGSWSLRAKIIRRTSTTQEIIVEGNGTNSVLIKTSYTAGTENLATDLVIKVNATGVATNDITQKNLTIKLYLQ